MYITCKRIQAKESYNYELKSTTKRGVARGLVGVGGADVTVFEVAVLDVRVGVL